MKGAGAPVVIGIGSPVVDLIAQVPDDFIARTGGAKGGMKLVDDLFLEDLIDALPASPVFAPGGSAGNTICALQACMAGHTVCTVEDALPVADLFVTATGNRDIITAEHMNRMKDQAVVCNIGHFDNEIQVAALNRCPGVKKTAIKPQVDRYTFPDGRSGLPCKHPSHRACAFSAGDRPKKRRNDGTDTGIVESDLCGTDIGGTGAGLPQVGRALRSGYTGGHGLRRPGGGRHHARRPPGIEGVPGA